MDERKAGITTATWQIVAQSFYPNEAALQAAEQDVRPALDGCAHDGLRRGSSARGRAKVWWIPLATPLDGDLRISATMPNGGTHEVALVGANRRTVVKRARVGRPAREAARRLDLRPALALRARHQKGALGRVRVSVTTP